MEAVDGEQVRRCVRHLPWAVHFISEDPFRNNSGQKESGNSSQYLHLVFIISGGLQ